MSKKNNLVDEIKLKYLKAELIAKKITKPTRADIERILNVSYPQAYNYLNALNENGRKNI
jgi:Mn-dependent DtxR family transcriptional regulator